MAHQGTEADSEPEPNAVFLALAYAESDADRLAIAYALALADLNAATDRLRTATDALIATDADAKRNRRRLKWFRRS